MTIRVAITFLFLTSCAILVSLPVRADIGGVGSPVVPSNPPPAAAPDNAAGASSDSDNVADNNGGERTPLLVIRFNQQHVYFERVLRQAVEATEKAKAGASYEVVSVEPSGNDPQQNERVSANSAANLNAVVQQMQSLGVQQSRIHTTTQSSSTAIAQEIDIFVE